jgi:tRNA A-37 threonylcarbamoyl transferase component Bud32
MSKGLISMDDLVLIGTGNTAEVYSWKEGLCLKLFKPGYEGNAQKEYNITNEIRRTTLRIPNVYDVINFKGRVGVLYERINGSSMFDTLMKTDDVKKCGEFFADLHYGVHSCSVPSLSSPRDEIGTLIEDCDLLGIEQRKQIYSLYQTLIDDDSLCHGDFHPLNIILSDIGPFIIDWTNCRSFHPLADIALSSIILKVAGFPKIIQMDFHDSYLKKYLELSSKDYISFLSWQIPLAIVRLNENKEAERNAILQLINNNLQKLGLLY